jgi:crotonobetainyl-CoA:carnitine CoA-transferase CaiB-like acyl-CoA transferase
MLSTLFALSPLPALRHNARMNALDAVRVLDLSRVLAGPWSTQTLADLGADVVKVERPGGGDDTRAWGPPFLKYPDGQDSAESAYFMGANRNKRSMTCDLSTAGGQDLMRQMASHAHVFVENYKVGDMKRYGLDYATLKQLNPALVYCSITGFGQTGPYQNRAGYDFAVQAMGGLMSVTGERDDAGGGPQKVGVAVADLFTGMYATVAILAALRHAERTGQGQHIDMALLDTQVAMLANLGANHLVNLPDQLPPPGRMGNAHVNIVPYQVFETSSKPCGARDFMIVAVGNDGQFARLCECVGHPEWSSDPRFARNQDRVMHRELLIPQLTHLMRLRPKAVWLSLLEASKVPCGPINDLAEVFNDPQVQARGMVESWHHPLQADLRLVASPMKLSATPVQHHLPPPCLGEHTADVLKDWLGMNASKVQALQSDQVI